MKRLMIQSLYILILCLLVTGCSFQEEPRTNVPIIPHVSTTTNSISTSPSLKDEKEGKLHEKIWQEVNPTIHYTYNLHPKTVYYQDQYIVLVFHHIDTTESSVTISPEKFKQDLQMLKDREFNIIPIEDSIQFLKGNLKLPPNAVVITFDDGYESFYRYAYPALSFLNFPATNFVIVNWIGTSRFKLSFLTWDEIKEMKKHGYSFYSHTFDSHVQQQGENGKKVPILAHPIFDPSKGRMETEQEFESRIQSDLHQAQQKLQEQLGVSVPVLCFPFGEYSKTVIDIANKERIEYFYTTKEGINSKNNKEILRINAGSPWMTADRLFKKIINYSKKN